MKAEELLARYAAEELLARYAAGERDFSHAVLSGARFSGADLSHSVLSGAVLRAADLSGADLSGADLTDADLSDADLTDAVLRGVRFSGAVLSGVRFSGAVITHGVITVCWPGHGECGRALHAVRMDDDTVWLWCGCFSGDSAALEAYIASGDEDLRPSREAALRAIMVIVESIREGMER